jgi:uncharacterized protein (DUF1330 family)
MSRFLVGVTALVGCATLATSAAGQNPVALEGAAASPASCNDPVLLLVWIEGLDRAKSKPYGDGLRATQIVPRHGGRYLAVSPPTLVLEGKWPAERGFVVEQYPCEQAFREMWFSREYQEKLKPLRDGSGEYTVALFKLRPQPVTPVPPKK